VNGALVDLCHLGWLAFRNISVLSLSQCVISLQSDLNHRKPKWGNGVWFSRANDGQSNIRQSIHFFPPDHECEFSVQAGSRVRRAWSASRPLTNGQNCRFDHVSQYLLSLKRYYKFPRTFAFSTNPMSWIKGRFALTVRQVTALLTTSFLNLPSKSLNL
jgi:hypothetical protein